MKQYVVIALFLALTLAWHQIVPRKVHDRIVPWAFAGLLCNICCSTFFSGGMHAMLGITNYLCYAICCDGFAWTQRNKNTIWKILALLGGYMILSATWGKYSFDGYFFWLNIFLTSFCPGYYVGLWMLRTEGGLRRILFPMTLVAGVTILLYYRYGGLAQLDAGVNRGVFDENALDEDVVFNQNAVAIYMIMLLVFLTVAIIKTPRTTLERIVKFAAIALSIPVALVMVRAGSRAGGTCLVPIGWYYLYSTTNSRRARKRVLLFALLVIGCFVGGGVMMRGADVIRTFSVKGDETASYSYDTNLDQITTGRVSMWLANIDAMSFGQCLVGRGLVARNEKTGRVTAGNAHCMYMTVFYNSGFVGVLLLLTCLGLAIREGLRAGDRGRLALLFIGVWIVHGIGESWGMGGGGTAIIAGLGIGLLSRSRIMNSEFVERSDSVPYGHGACVGWRSM